MGRSVSDRGMTDLNDLQAPVAPAILTPDGQEAVWFVGALVRVRLGGAATAGQLAVLELQAERGNASPLHRHDAADETFFVLDGELRVEVDGVAQAAGAGTVAFLPRKLPHAVVVTSPQVRYLTIHQPAGFDDFVQAAGTRATTTDIRAADDRLPDLAALAALASRYNIEILGPPPAA